MSSAIWHLDGPVHIRWGSTSTRETLMIAGWACSTISEFTDILSGNQYCPCAGPFTEMYLLEASASPLPTLHQAEKSSLVPQRGKGCRNRKLRKLAGLKDFPGML